MPDILVIAHPWIKSLHIISVILWMGAQLLLPFLLAAHRGLPTSSAQARLLTEIERGLISHVMNPAILATFLFGALLAKTMIDTSEHFPRWLPLKLALVFSLAALHGKLLKQFSRATDGRTQWPTWAYRFVQGLNLVLLAAVVLLVVARPLS